MAVEFKDYSIEVKAAIDDEMVAWLHEWSAEIASKAKRNCSRGEEYSTKLAGSYRNEVNAQAGIAKIGTPMQEGLWEEFGTGEHAVKEPHRSGWWVYIEGGSGYEGETNHYSSYEEAAKMAAYISERYGLKAVATNGRDPNYTLEKAFTVTEPKAKADAEKRLKRRLGN